MRIRPHILAALAGLLGTSAPAAAGALSFTPVAVIVVDKKGARLAAPEGVGCDAAGNILVADTQNGRLLRYTLKNGVVTAGVEIKLAELPYPRQVALDDHGDAVVLDGKTHKLVRVGADGTFKGALDMKRVPGSPIILPVAFSLDATGSLYVLDSAGNRVVAFDGTGAFTRAVPFPKGPGLFTAIYSDGKGALYAAEAKTVALFRLDPEGVWAQVGDSLSGYLSFPAHLTGDAAGRLFVVDQHGHGVAVVNHDGSFMGRQLGLGWVEGLVYYPTEICLDGKGNVVVADRGNNRVQIFASH
ncbi:MAG: NHL repeat-containing protein [Deltaproteobacteria bacterium]|nr:NHL repeat-containing protein [Deltaproteobacteria bacterium]